MPKTNPTTPRVPPAAKISRPTETATTDPLPEPPAARPTKLAMIVELVSRPDGARVEELMEATGWQAHSVRGALSGGVKKQLKLTVTSQKTDAGRIYRVVGEAQQ